MTAVPVLELRDAAALIPYARNSNTHPPSQIALIKRSMLEYGWTNPVLVDGESVVAGHGRLQAVLELYDEGKQIRFPNGALIPPGKVPVLSCTGWSEAQRRAYVIADNAIASQADLDPEVLALELGDLDKMGFDLTLTGLEADDLRDLLGQAKELDGMPDLPDGDKGEFEKMTFSLHQDQADVVREALAKAKSASTFDTTLNKNSNGNALHALALAYLGRKHG